MIIYITILVGHTITFENVFFYSVDFSVYLVTYDVVQGKELIQTKFHRTDEAVLSLAKDLVEEFNSSKLDSNEPPTSYKKKPTGTSTEGHLMHVKI